MQRTLSFWSNTIARDNKLNFTKSRLDAPSSKGCCSDVLRFVHSARFRSRFRLPHLHILCDSAAFHRDDDQVSDLSGTQKCVQARLNINSYQ